MLPGFFSRLTGRLFLSQWLGNLLLMLLIAGWLQTIGSRGWYFAASILAGALLAVAFLSFWVATARMLRPCGLRPPLPLACLLLVALLALWWLSLTPIAAGRSHESAAAGYLAAQWPAWFGRSLGYSRLVAWQEHIYDCLQYLLAGLWLPIALEMCACGLEPGWLLRALRVYRRVPYWCWVLFGGFAASAITWTLASLNWTSAVGIPRGGSASLGNPSVAMAISLAAAFTLNIALWSGLLALTAHYLAPHRSSAIPKRSIQPG